MKGITPVIAIILLLLITISMVGFAFVWFQRVAQTATDSTDTQLQQQLSQQAQKIRIESAAGTAVNLRNTGSQSIPASAVAIFVNGTATTSGNCPSVPQAAGSVFACSSTAAVCSGSSTIRVTAPGNSDQIIC
ncbi:MAG: hypothetical protein J4400_01785 [Candidatus Aenigmarchaeota archaeon]|nr:hypothetical protein [Candidatus Aenigmarchaeota archaeon]